MILCISWQDKVSTADALSYASLPDVPAAQTMWTDYDGWVMSTVWRMAGRIKKDNRACRRSAAIPADLGPRMNATSVIKTVTPALVSPDKAMLLQPSKQLETLDLLSSLIDEAYTAILLKLHLELPLRLFVYNSSVIEVNCPGGGEKQHAQWSKFPSTYYQYYLQMTQMCF